MNVHTRCAIIHYVFTCVKFPFLKIKLKIACAFWSAAYGFRAPKLKVRDYWQWAGCNLTATQLCHFSLTTFLCTFPRCGLMWYIRLCVCRCDCLRCVPCVHALKCPVIPFPPSVHTYRNLEQTHISTKEKKKRGKTYIETYYRRMFFHAQDTGVCG